MGLKQLNHKERIHFLLKFVGELIINSVESKRLKELIKAEKIKQKYVYPDSNKAFDEFGKSVIFRKEGKRVDVEKKSSSYRESSMQKSEFEKSPVVDKIESKLNYDSDGQNMGQVPVNKNPTAASAYLKIDPFIKDMSVGLIECPGPGKNILVKVRNKINTTKIILSEEEIKDIINHYSERAKIPVEGGVLRAAVDDLIISAVTSNFVGSRFILTKKSPYELIEGVN